MTVSQTLESIYNALPQQWGNVVEKLCQEVEPALVYEAVHDNYSSRLAEFPYEKVWGSLPFSKSKIQTIGICCFKMSGGGLERAQRLLAHQFLACGYRVIWLMDEEYSKECNDQRISVFYLPVTPVSARWQKLKSILTKEKVDVCIFGDHWRDTHFADLLAAREVSCRTIVAYHTGFFSPLVRGKPSLHRLRRAVYPLATAVLALSPINVAWFRADGISNVIYMPNLLTFGNVTHKPRYVATGRFLFIGRLVELKGLERALVALSELRKTHPQATLTVLGAPSSVTYGISLRKLATRLGIREAVNFKGEVRDVGDYLERGDALLMCSLVEGAPMVLMEAKSYGIPAIIFSMPYVDATRLEDGVVSVPYDDCEGMAREMARLLDDSNYYHSLCVAAQASLSSFSTDLIMKRWFAVFDSLNTGRLPSSPDVSPEELLRIAMTELQSVSTSWVREKATMRKVMRSAGKTDQSGHRLIKVALKLDAFLHELFPRENSLGRKFLRVLFVLVVDSPMKGMRWVLHKVGL